MEAKRAELQKIRDKNARRMDRARVLRAKQEEQENSGPDNLISVDQQPSLSKEQPITSQKVAKTRILTASAIEAIRNPISTRTAATQKVLKEKPCQAKPLRD